MTKQTTISSFYQGVFGKARMRGFIIGAILISLGVPSWPGGTAQGQSNGTWTLKQVRVFNTMDGNYATITSERYDENGGSVDIQISGDILGGTCPGGFEKLRFTWRFERSVAQIVHGGAVSASLAAGQVTKSQNCGTQIASRSLLSLTPSAGGSSPFSVQETRLMDGERFIAGNRKRVRAAEPADYERNGIGSININTHAQSPNSPFAFFSIDIGTPTKSNSMLRYVYLYERSSGGNSGGGASFGPRNDNAGLNGERLTFYRGTTPEQCQADCANNPNCKGYTLIRAGAYNAGDPPMCYLMSSVKDFAPSPCCISAIKK